MKQIIEQNKKKNRESKRLLWWANIATKFHTIWMKNIIHRFIQPGPKPLYPFIKEVRIYEGRVCDKPYHLVFMVDPVKRPNNYPDNVDDKLQLTKDKHLKYYEYLNFLGRTNSHPCRYLHNFEYVCRSKKLKNRMSLDWMGWVVRIDNEDTEISSLEEFIKRDTFVIIWRKNKLKKPCVGPQKSKSSTTLTKEVQPIDK